MSKTIVVSEETWKKLVYFKTENKLKSMDEAIDTLLKEDKEKNK